MKSTGHEPPLSTTLFRRAGTVALIAAAVLIVYGLAPGREDLPVAAVSVVAYFVAQVVLPHWRIRAALPLCPVNIALFLFGAQLVVLPMVAVYFGFVPGSLHSLPSAYAMNLALLVATLAYLACGLSYHLTVSRPVDRTHEENNEERIPARHPRYASVLLVVFTIVGLAGFYFFFGSWSRYIDYLEAPISRVMLMDDLSGSIVGAASTFFRPFLAFALVLGWSLWISRHGAMKPRGVTGTVTLLVALLCAFINLGFGYNRGAVLGPVLGILAAYSATVRRISFASLAVLGAIVFPVILLWGVFRASGLESRELTDAQILSSLNAKTDVVEWLEVYGSAPQFSGYLIEQTGYGKNLYGGTTLISSLLYPIPVVGRAFRSTSGVEIYNRLIYGDLYYVDQVVPFQAELFINFHLAGVVLGFVLVGWLTARFQHGFETAGNAFESYSLFLMSLWVLFLVPGSLAVTSQIYIYCFWPVYVYLAWKSITGFHQSVKGHS